MAWSGIRKSGKRSAVSRESLESAVTEAVKPLLDGEPFVGVIIQHIEPKSRTDSNWAIRGVRSGKADREKSRKVLELGVERLQRDFILAQDRKGNPQIEESKSEVIEIRRAEEGEQGSSTASEHD